MQYSRSLRNVAVVLGFVATLSAGFTVPAFAADWYVAPLTNPPAKASPSGSEDDPFATVNAAIRSGKVKGGDRILLKDGPHGRLVLEKVAFDSQVTITSQNDKNAQLDSVLIRFESHRIRLLNLSVWKTDPSISVPWLVQGGSTTSEIVVEGLVVRSEQGDVEKFVSWDALTWGARKSSGIRLDGRNSTALRNDLLGVGFGISLSGDDSKAIENIVNFYDGDGLRGFGSNNVFLRNQVYNCIKTDGNHADGFQSFAGDSGSVKGLVLDSNVIIEWTHPQKDHPLRCRLQGIGMFDGFYDDLTIVNNLVTTTQYHGISVYGARNAIISNNTVAHTDNLTSTTPYIAVYKHKNGTLPTDVLVSNNVAMSVRGEPSIDRRVEFRNNSVVGTPGAVFEDPFALNYRPKATSGFIDTADPASSTSNDIIGNRRPAGNGPDRGAYEVVVATAPTEPDPVVTEPVVTDPVNPEVTDPVVTDPIVTEPVPTDPIVTEPVVTDPIVTEPVLTDPVVADPVMTDPVVTDPIVTEPVIIDPTVTDPFVSDPVVAAPTKKKPGMQRGKEKTLDRSSADRLSIK